MELFHLSALIGSKIHLQHDVYLIQWFQNMPQNRKWNYLTLFHSSDQKTSFFTVCSFDLRKWNYFTYFHSKDSKTSFNNRKCIFLNRKWNYFTHFRISYQMIQGFQNMFQIRKWNLLQEMKLFHTCQIFHTCPFLWSKQIFRNSMFIWSKVSKNRF